MRNLFAFFIRFHLVFLFLALEAVSFTLLLNSNRFHRTAFMNASTAISSSVYNRANYVGDYFRLRAINDSLLAENAYLRNVTGMEGSADGQFISSIARSPLDLPDSVYSFVPAKVIRNSTTRARNYIYLDKGSKHGIQKDMGVLDHRGIAGVVVNTSANYSIAMSLLHKDMRISAKLKRNNYFGGLVWEGFTDHEVLFKDLPKHIDIEIGDTVVTSGYSSFFPENVLVGQVTKIEPIAGTNFLDVTVDVSTNFKNISHAYVVKVHGKQEIQQLMLQEDG